MRGRYLYVPDDGLAGCPDILKTLLNAGVRGDALLVTVDQRDGIDQIVRCLTGVGNRRQYLWFILNAM